jgi:hypothetical protein
MPDAGDVFAAIIIAAISTGHFAITLLFFASLSFLMPLPVFRHFHAMPFIFATFFAAAEMPPVFFDIFAG